MSAARERTVDGAGVRLAVQERGDPARPTVLLVHGYPDDHGVWDAVAEELAGRWHVVTYDVRGAGGSDRPPATGDHSLALLAADLLAVADATSPGEAVHLVGHDWGSVQGWEAVCTRPERFASWTSVSGPCLDHLGALVAARLRRPTPRHLWQVLVQALHSWYVYVFLVPGLAERLWPRAPLRLLADLGVDPGDPAAARRLRRDAAHGVRLYRANVPARLRHPRERRTPVRTLLLVPEHDAYITPASAVEAPQGWVGDLAVERIDAGHWVQREQPAEFARLVERHLTG